MKEITEADYTAGIPKCCSMQTYQQHADILLCWGLVAALEREQPMDCRRCPLRNPAIPSETVSEHQPEKK